MTRRSLLLLPAIALAQRTAPRVSVIWTTNAIPEAFARQAVVFPRSYVCCPDDGQAQRSLERGRFPHAITSADPTLWNFFDKGDGITVLTSASSDGFDGPEDHSIRVPLAIRWPGRLQPRVVNEILFSHADVLPTLLGLTGQAIPASLQGRDLSTWLLRGSGPRPEAIYSEGRRETREEWRALVRGFDKIVWDLRDEIVGLYNLADDPDEQVDLQDKREHRINRDSMWALARQWMQRLEDGVDARGFRTRRPA